MNTIRINGGKNGLNSFCKNCRHEINISTEVSTKRKESNLIKKYELSLDSYNAILAKQNNCCAICRISVVDYGKTLDVDHDHKTGEVRGLLCNHCNRGIGYFRDNYYNLVKAASYVADKFSKKGD